MSKFIEDSQKSLKEAYRAAIRSNQENFFEHSLLACALDKTDEDGFLLRTMLLNRTVQS